MRATDNTSVEKKCKERNWKHVLYLTTRGLFLCRKLGWWNCWEYTYRDIVGINVENNFVILREKDKVYSCTHLLTHAVPPKSGNMRPLMLDFIRGMQERG